MFSFRSITLFAALACATLSSAIPVVDVAGINDLSASNNGVQSPPDTAPVHDSRADASTKSCPEIYNGATTAIQPIVANLKVALSVDVVDKVVVVGHLNEIVVVIKAAIADVQLLVKADVAVVLNLNGVICTVHQLSLIIYGLFDILLGVLFLVSKAVIYADVAVSSVVISIGGLVVDLLNITLTVVVDLKVDLAVVIKPLVSIISSLPCGQILVVLGITV